MWMSRTNTIVRCYQNYQFFSSFNNRPSICVATICKIIYNIFITTCMNKYILMAFGMHNFLHYKCRVTSACVLYKYAHILCTFQMITLLAPNAWPLLFVMMEKKLLFHLQFILTCILSGCLNVKYYEMD